MPPADPFNVRLCGASQLCGDGAADYPDPIAFRLRFHESIDAGIR
jgi:hypothetical protein